MGKIEISIENNKSAHLKVENSLNNFGVYPKSKNEYVVGFENNPLFEINHSLVNERWFFDVLPTGGKIPCENIIFNESTDHWLRDSCCSDFSIFNYLPDGEYKLVKTGRKARFMEEILYGNEWADATHNVLTFDGIKEKDSMLKGTSDKSIGKQKYYPLIIGGNVDRVPVINQPLLCTILLDYGIVWDGATGFIFFSFASNETIMKEQKKMILLIPYCDSFIIDCMSRKALFNKRVIDDFIKII